MVSSYENEFVSGLLVGGKQMHMMREHCDLLFDA